jgi:hypothetical protein
VSLWFHPADHARIKHQAFLLEGERHRLIAELQFDKKKLKLKEYANNITLTRRLTKM